jgi:hypothetical protein
MEVCGHLEAQPLYFEGKSPTLARRLDRPQSWSGHCEKEERFLPLPRIEPQFLGHPAPCYTDCAISIQAHRRVQLQRTNEAARPVL